MREKCLEKDSQLGCDRICTVRPWLDFSTFNGKSISLSHPQRGRLYIVFVPEAFVYITCFQVTETT